MKLATRNSNVPLVLAAIGIAFSPPGTAAVGKTEVAYQVSNTGEATYAIPIWSPPGTAGLKPTLSLSYGHLAGGTWSGHGWSVSGLSAITRCPKTWAQDGQSRSVKLDSQDRFCLNGNQLKLVAGTYGSNGAEYRTEIETFARVRSYGSAGSGPAYFVVESKDGLITEYGNTTDSRIESVGGATARSWLVSKLRDRRNNYISYTYTEDTTLGSFRIATISYTGNSTQGVSPPYAINFVYETQPVAEVESGYLANSLIKDVTRLTRVDVSHSSTLLRRYNIAYEGSLSSASRSRLASVTECAGTSGTDCYPATTFSYQNGTNSFNNRADLTTPSTAAPIVMDINGDGRTDIAYSSSNTSGAGTWRIRFSDGTGFGSEINTGIANTEYYTAVPIDYNADGFGDLMVRYPSGTLWIMQGSSSGFSSPFDTGVFVSTFASMRALDVNGDGLDDVIYTDGTQVRYRLRVWGGTFGAEQVFVPPSTAFISLPADSTAYQYGRNPDFDGDGREDFVYYETYFDWVTWEVGRAYAPPKHFHRVIACLLEQRTRSATKADVQSSEHYISD